MSDSTDLQRSRDRAGVIQRLGRFFLDAGYQAITLHRVAHTLHKKRLTVLGELVRRLNIALTGADVHVAAQIGHRVSFIHPVGIVVGKGVVIEGNCEIFGGVVLGGLGGERTHDGFPLIRCDTVICVGAKVLGPIVVGRHVTVSAGAVVLSSVPDHALVAGVPAQVKKIYQRADE